MKFFKRRKIKGQALVELAMMLSLIFLFVVVGVEIFYDTQGAVRKDVEKRNYDLWVTKNASVRPPDFVTFKVPDISRFNPPAGSGWPWDNPGSLYGPFRDNILGLLGLDGELHWWKSGMRGALDAWAASGFKDGEEALWGFGGGVVSSGDFHNLLGGQMSSLFGDSIGDIMTAGIQGTLTAAMANHELVFGQGKWGDALMAGAQAAYMSDAMQDGLAKGFGERDFFISTANGAVLGAMTGEGALLGMGKGALGSKLVQDGIGSAAFGKDYLVNAVNVTAVNVMTGSKEPLFYGAAQAAFMTGSVQSSLFGDKPGALMTGIKGVANAGVSGGLQAVRHGDVDMLVDSLKGAAIGEGARLAMDQTVGLVYGAPEAPGENATAAEIKEYNQKMDDYMSNRQFISGMATVGTVVLADPELGASYAEMMAQQALYSKVNDELTELRGKGKDSTGSEGEENTTDGTGPAEGEGTEETTPTKGGESLIDGNVPLAFKIDRQVIEELKSDKRYYTSINKSVKDPLTDESRRFSSLFASRYNDITLASYNKNIIAANKRAIKKAKNISKNKNTAKKTPGTKSKRNARRPLTKKEILFILERFETINAAEVVKTAFFKELQKEKPLAKKILTYEFGKYLTLLTAYSFSKHGLLDSQIKELLKRKSYQDSLRFVLQNKNIIKRMDLIVDYALSRDNVIAQIKKIQERVVIARAFQTEKMVRQALLSSQKSGIIYERPEPKKTFVEKLMGIFS